MLSYRMDLYFQCKCTYISRSQFASTFLCDKINGKAAFICTFMMYLRGKKVSCTWTILQIKKSFEKSNLDKLP